MKDAPAFPTTVRGKQEGRNMKPLQRLEGMTLRDYFAAKMMLYTVNHFPTYEQSSADAYKIADAMMEARNG